jgi:hypothetical protein
MKLAEETIITWSFANWVTVVLMAMVAFGIWGFALKVWQKRQQTQGQQ